MRVVHLVPAPFAPRSGIFGGAERYALELARHMANVVPTTLLTFADQASDETRDGLRIRVLGGARWVRGQRSNPFHADAFRELLRADVVHCHQQHVLMTSLAAIFCRIRRRRVFVTDLGGGGWDLSAYVNTDGWFDGHLHVSRYSLEIAGHRDRANASVISGGVDTRRFSPARPRDPAPRVLFVGRLLPHKGVDYLVESLPRGIALKIVGSVMDAAYLDLLKQLAQDKQVSFEHDVSDDRLVEEYRRASCIVLPSVYETRAGGRTRVPELLGQTLLEGMSCGLPAIATNVASLPEVVDADVGSVVPPNDPTSLREAIVALHEDRVRACNMGERARQRVERSFTWPDVVERCLRAYER